MPRELDIKSFHHSIEADITQAHNIISSIEDVIRYPYDRSDHDRAELEEQFEDILRRTIEKLAIALELCGLTDAVRRLKRRFETYQREELIELRYAADTDVFYSPALSEIAVTLEALLVCLGMRSAGMAERSDQVLRRILLGTGKLIADRKLDPRNESEVRNEIYGVLLHVFPDTVRELPIPQISKTYKPDIAVRHLRTAIEYKFADTPDELKKALEGIYADTKGYSGSEDWTRFIAVIYCTEVFMTDAQLAEEGKSVGMPESWEIILVTGRGGRKPHKATGAGKGAGIPAPTKETTDSSPPNRRFKTSPK